MGCERDGGKRNGIIRMREEKKGQGEREIEIKECNALEGDKH